MGITVPTYLVCIYIDLSFRYPYIHDNFHYAGWVFRLHSLLVMLRMHLCMYVGTVHRFEELANPTRVWAPQV